MKSASRPGSLMVPASVCRSSDSSGDSETTFWKLVLMLRIRASISVRSAVRRASRAGRTRARRYGLVAVISSSDRRLKPWTMRRKLPSGSLNILWIWLAVPTG